MAAAAGGTGPSSVAALRSDDADLAAKSRSAVLELYSLDARLTTANSRLARIRAATTRLKAQRAELVRQIRIARVDTRLSQARLATRLRFIYEHGSSSTLELVMGATSIQDALTQIDDYDRVAASNTSVMLELEGARKHLAHLSRTLASRRQSLSAALLGASEEADRLQQLATARSAYVAQLGTRRSLDAAKIAHLQAAAALADTRAQALAAEAPPAPTVVAETVSAPPAVTAPGAHTLTVVATGYDLPGHTATGLPVGFGIAAVDPSVIPLGTRIVIPGYGEAIAADTGPAIVGGTIDLWFPTAAQAYAWGRRTVTISIN
jgi:cystine transport system substrate-binding protein